MADDIHNIITEVVIKAISEHPLKIEKIGGMTNTNYYCETKNTKTVVRLPGENTNILINRGNEKNNCQLATALGINPKLYYYNVDSGIKITEYVDNAITLTPKIINKKINLENAALLLQSLHQSDIIFKNTFNVFEEYNRYLSNLNRDEINYPNFNETESYFLKLEKRLNQLGIHLSPCHNDPVPENFIYNENSYYLIDWEYSGMNDSSWDIAALCEESHLSDDDENIFLNYYLNNSISELDNIKEKILIYKICQNYLWSIWTLIKEKNENLFGSYGVDRYQKCKAQIEIHKEKYATN
ncbi:phosphotransferase [Morganella psychrotolerans]|uniref:Phosphotransferase n=1 Tax=Morganella psychrotolerans TaxID=368603 RepID=A0A5M9R1B8_9GAMM|nr:choline/ethanolamine kinase family protein [Morganella psychrotolerans]KAA8713235.1 phosphotransferase [Morganella psychrotolerans]